MANKRVVLVGRGRVTLRDADYVAQGGEGTVYRLHDTVVKLYHDPVRAVQNGIASKIRALHALAHRGIAAPVDVVESNGSVVGHYLPWCDGEPLARTFGNDWRARENYGDDDALRTVRGMRDITVHAHAQGATMCDANELNWILRFDRTTCEPWIIDVDSWSIERWRASVVMPSIRDYTSTSFDARSDWFAIAVVAYQVLVGIHPYKGRVDGYKLGELERRMRDGVSVFRDGVRVPSSARDPGVIPRPLFDWFHSVFEKGLREPMPDPSARGAPAVIARTHRTVAVGTGACAHDVVWMDHRGRRVLRVWHCGVVLLDDGTFVDVERGTSTEKSPFGMEARVERVGAHLALAQHGVGVALDGDVLATRSDAHYWTSNGALFELHGEHLSRLDALHVGKRTLIERAPPVTVLPNSTRSFEGVVVMDALGATFVMVAHGRGVAQVRVPELDGAKIVDARSRGRFATFLAVLRDGSRVRHELWFDAARRTYAHWSGASDANALNAAILERGVVAMVLDDEVLTLYVPSSGEVRHLRDPSVLVVDALYTWRDRVVYLRDGKIWQLRAR